MREKSKPMTRKNSLMPPYPLTNFEMQRFYQKEARLNSFYWRPNLPEIQDGTYIINLDNYWLIGTHCIALYVNDTNETNFDSFEVEHIPKEMKEIMGDKNIITNICKLQAYDSVMCGCFCFWLIDFMLNKESART